MAPYHHKMQHPELHVELIQTGEKSKQVWIRYTTNKITFNFTMIVLPSSLIAFSLRPKTAETAEAEVAAASSVTAPGEATWTRHQHTYRPLNM